MAEPYPNTSTHARTNAIVSSTPSRQVPSWSSNSRFTDSWCGLTCSPEEFLYQRSSRTPETSISPEKATLLKSYMPSRNTDKTRPVSHTGFLSSNHCSTTCIPNFLEHRLVVENFTFFAVTVHPRPSKKIASSSEAGVSLASVVEEFLVSDFGCIGHHTGPYIAAGQQQPLSWKNSML